MHTCKHMEVVKTIYTKIPLLRLLIKKTTPLLRPAIASPQFFFVWLFYIAPDKWGIHIIFFLLLQKTYVVGTHKKRLTLGTYLKRLAVGTH